MDLLRILFVGLLLFVAATCAHRDEPRSESESKPPVEREISTDRADAVDSGAGTPEREASMKVVEEGKGYLIADKPGQAARRFEHATQIDPTNGFAYYFLGRARFDAGDRDAAVGVLEKAETLLGPYPDWQVRATQLLAVARGF